MAVNAFAYADAWDDGFNKGIQYYFQAAGIVLPTFDEWEGKSAAWKNGWSVGLKVGRQIETKSKESR